MATAVAPVPALRRWLAENLDVAPGELCMAPLPTSGDSNMMFEIACSDRRWVLRAPPAVKNDQSAHDVLREFRILVALELTPVPHPRPVAACGDPSIIGTPFYVMSSVNGFSPSDPLPESWQRAPELRDLGPRAVEALADLAQVPWRSIGLDGFGRPDGFLARQVPRWLRQLERYEVRQLEGLRQVARWLEEHRPAATPPAILHGDFHLRNVMFASDPPAEVAAIVDWEMATIGDPLLDLGALLATWSEPGEEVLMNGSVTQHDGMATRVELAEAYERHGGRSLEHIDYYAALALFKLACILEGSYSRLLAGQSQHEGHRTYATLVPIMVRRAVAITNGAWSVG